MAAERVADPHRLLVRSDAVMALPFGIMSEVPC